MTDPVDLEAMTKDDLLAYAQGLGVTPANAGMTKAQLIEAIGTAGADQRVIDGGDQAAADDWYAPNQQSVRPDGSGPAEEGAGGTEHPNPKQESAT